MKKWLSALVIVLLLLLAGVYIFIPPKIIITRYARFKSTPGGVDRFLSQKNKWNAWWPEKEKNSGDTSFTYNGYVFSISVLLPGSIGIDINNDDKAYSSLLSILSLSRDSVGITWQCDMPTSSNPLQRFQRFNESKRVSAAMAGLLDSMRAFLEKLENVYAINVTQTMVTDTLLVTTKSISATYPTTQEVYQLIGQLKNYMTSQNAQAVNPPMLYVQRTEDNRFQTMVAIPVNKPLAGTADIPFKRMVPGKILVTEIKGGPYTVRRAFEQMEFYAEDYKKIAPAIPFEMLMTDRMQETDTSKWVTRIYYPIL